MYDLSEENVKRITEMTRRMRLMGLDMALSTGNGGSHLGGSFSCMEILAVLYGEILNISPETAGSPGRDIFIPSKNHCVLAHIPALAEAGFIEKNEIMEFQKNGGRLTGYPMRKEIGLEYSGGSLGMAISVAIGMALAEPEGSKRKFYVLMGDAELNEGSIWEAAASAGHYGLNQLVAIVDMNAIQYDGYTTEVLNMSPLEKKWQDFGWNTIVIDGHDIEAILDAYNYRGEKPLAILAHTIKGKGISFMENNWRFHNAALTNAQYEQSIGELEAAK